MAKKKKVSKPTRKASKKKATRAVGRSARTASAPRTKRKRILERDKPEPVTGVYDPQATSGGTPLYLDVDHGLVQGPDAGQSSRPSKRKLAFVILGVLALLLAIGWCRFFPATLGPKTGSVQLPGLSAPVEVRRDALGVPYIEASNDDDLFLAVGYAMAQDRFWQMVLLKRSAQGRLAEVLGPRLLDYDVYVRTLGLKLAAEQAYPRQPARVKRIMTRFAEGVNHYRTTQRLPIEFSLAGLEPEPWLPSDSLVVFGMMKLDLSANLKEELAFLKLAQALGPEKAALLFPSYPGEDLPVEAARLLRGLDLRPVADDAKKMALLPSVFRQPSFGASNNWAVAPQRTKAGASLLANDTHLKIGVPSAWYIMNLKSPTYRAAGTLVPGIPLVVLGYNGHVSWGATMVQADVQDIFLEKLRGSGNKQEYLHRGVWRPVTWRREVFGIKGKDPTERVIGSTIHGPLLNDAVRAPRLMGYQPEPFTTRLGLAVAWANDHGDRSAQGFLDMADARTLGQARRALANIDTIYLNVVMADRNQVAWQTTGRLPRRGRGRGQLPAPGWTGEYDWRGYLPFSEQPGSYAPKEGYVGTANHRVTTRPAPYHMGSAWAPPERMERLRFLLEQEKSATLETMANMQLDVRSNLALKVKTILSQGQLATEVTVAIAAMPAERQKSARGALEILSKFDGEMKVDSAGAALIAAFYQSISHELLQDELGGADDDLWKTFKAGSSGYGAEQDHLQFRADSPFWDDVRTKDKVEQRPEIVARALAAAFDFCDDQMGSSSRWRWGRLHTYHWQHPIASKAWFLRWHLNRGPYAAAGDGHTLNVSGFTWGSGFETEHIPAMRLLVDYSRPEPAFLITHMGISGNPASANYASMIPLFLEGKQNQLPFAEANIKKQYDSVLVLEPQKK